MPITTLSRPIRYTLAAVCTLALLSLPFAAPSPYVLFVANLILLYIILAVGLNLPVGLTGQISLCHAAFWGLGAYFSAILTERFGWSFWVALPLSGLFAGVFGLLIGLSTMRVAGDYLALVTVGFGEVVRVIFLNWVDMTNGPMGITKIPHPNSIGPIVFDNYTSFYYLLLAATGLIIWTTNRYIKSRVGLAFRAAQDEIAAQSLGINTLFYKILAYTLGAIYAGWAGSLYVHMVGLVSPETFTFAASVTVLSMVIIGGQGSLMGAIIGSLALMIISEALRDLLVWRMIVYGIVLTVSMVFMPGGLVGLYRNLTARRRGPTDGATQPLARPSAETESGAGMAGARQRVSGASPATAGDPPPQTVALLETRLLTVLFDSLAAVKDLDLVIRPGSIHSIIGPNGAGKTTLFNAITGIHPASSGSIHLNGRPIEGRRPHEVARLGIARTFQTTRLFPTMTVIENMLVAQHNHTHTNLIGAVARPPSVAREEAVSLEKARDILAFLELTGYDRLYPSQIDYASQRRLEIALALATEPRLVLLDEPAAGLNPHETHESMMLIGRIREYGVTVVLIEHEMEVVMNISDRVTVLNYGTKIAEGTPAEVQDNPIVVEAYLGRRRSNA